MIQLPNGVSINDGIAEKEINGTLYVFLVPSATTPMLAIRQLIDMSDNDIIKIGVAKEAVDGAKGTREG